jgi:hypothetical protein
LLYIFPEAVPATKIDEKSALNSTNPTRYEAASGKIGPLYIFPEAVPATQSKNKSALNTTNPAR